ncbi:hypothetical protein PAXRUDRAFT_830025 [Paxillus rubicundulus Ve08.2h10]|uniref:Uncharacterized protein n=1 Tax=Paxillus rubicundulus Ve08.2h10 TaxID=930991 RepID=A0A0D0DLS8_9AGAM|nr:hypothetical protein PAXRUDRAFT_830025 [Paxillus rubicundulus Ve08.2h10]
MQTHGISIEVAEASAETFKPHDLGIELPCKGLSSFPLHHFGTSPTMKEPVSEPAWTMNPTHSDGLNIFGRCVVLPWKLRTTIKQSAQMTGCQT